MLIRVAIFVGLLLLPGMAFGGDCPDVMVQTKSDMLNLDKFNGYPWCRHTALLCAIIYGEYYPVRFQVGPIKCGGIHVQAQAFIDEEWKYLYYDRQASIAKIGEQDDFFTPKKTETIIEFINHEYTFYGWTSDSRKSPLLMKEIHAKKLSTMITSGTTSFSLGRIK